MVLVKRIIFLTSTTPAAATASAFPSSAEEGSFVPLISQKVSAHGECRSPVHRSRLYCCKTRVTLSLLPAHQIDPSRAARNDGRSGRRFHRDRERSPHHAGGYRRAQTRARRLFPAPFRSIAGPGSRQ